MSTFVNCKLRVSRTFMVLMKGWCVECGLAVKLYGTSSGDVVDWDTLHDGHVAEKREDDETCVDTSTRVDQRYDD